MMTDAYALRHGWSVLLCNGINLAYRGPLWAPYATAHCRPAVYGKPLWPETVRALATMGPIPL